MKRGLAWLLLWGAPALAGDWIVYHSDAKTGQEFAFDQDTLRQSPPGFSTVVRVRVDKGEQKVDSLLDLKLDCQASRYQITNERHLREGRYVTVNVPAFEGAIGDNPVVLLKDAYCAEWREPADVRWVDFASGRGRKYYYDETPLRGASGGFREGFTTHVKNVGPDLSFLMKVRLTCADSRYEILSEVVRRETHGGQLINNSPAKPEPIVAGSWPAALKSQFCAADIEARSARAAEDERQRQATQARQERNARECDNLIDQAADKVRLLEFHTTNVIPQCHTLHYHLKDFRRMSSYAREIGCRVLIDGDNSLDKVIDNIQRTDCN